jgi:hypothetical protein
VSRSYCYRRAGECRELAALGTTPIDKTSYTEREQGWLLLERSYEFSDRGRSGDPIMRARWREKARTEVRATGYVAHSLEAALWCVDGSADYRSAVLLDANLGEDADTTAAVTRQLAGALYGASGIPDNWVRRIAWGEQIRTKATNLVRNTARETSQTKAVCHARSSCNCYPMRWRRQKMS